MNQEQRFGFLSGMGAYFIWGFLPLYLTLLRHVSAVDVLSHRVVWSIPTALILITIGSRWNELFRMLQSRNALWLILSSAVIGTNWLIYIWAVGQGRIMEASLGYFINPLVNVAIASIFLSERLRRLQWVAIGFAVIAVLIETFALGRLPWVSLVLAGSFSVYGLIRRKLVVDSRVGFSIEVLVLFPIALIWMLIAAQNGRSFYGDGLGDMLLLMLAGPVTAVPLLLFALAAKRLRFSTIGIMQYLGPSLQFLVALGLGETLTPLRGLTFVLIWIGVMIFSFDAFRNDRAQRRQARLDAAQLEPVSG